MQKVKVNDIQVCYELHGEGFPLIMIMGLGGNMDCWDPRLIQELSKKYKLVTFDNRGAGRSDVSDREYTVKLFANDTAGLVDALRIDRSNVLGISMGGMIAQEFALTYPQKVEKLVLCSTHCGASKSVPPAPEIQNLVFSGTIGTLDDMIKKIIPILFTEDFIKNHPDYIELATEQIMKAPITPDAFMRQVKAIMEWDSYTRLPKIKIPTLVMHGKKDMLVPSENAKILTDRIPGAKLAYFEKTAHALFSQETDKVVSTVLKFLA